jgi:hypothetical protein
MTSFLPTLRSVASKAAQMIEDSLYHDLLRLFIAFDEAEGLVCGSSPSTTSMRTCARW